MQTYHVSNIPMHVFTISFFPSFMMAVAVTEKVTGVVACARVRLVALQKTIYPVQEDHHMYSA